MLRSYRSLSLSKWIKNLKPWNCNTHESKRKAVATVSILIWMRRAPWKHLLLLEPQLLEQAEKNSEVYPFRRSCVTSGKLWFFQSPLLPKTLSLGLLTQCLWIKLWVIKCYSTAPTCSLAFWNHKPN